MNSTESILRNFKLRTTPSRESILQLFLKRHYALSHSDIESETQVEFDRVTVYRTLKTFLDKGIIHKVLDDAGGLKYALCSEACSETNHHHNHVHFKCMVCGQTKCLSTEIPTIKLPKGFQVQETNVLIHGVCGKCN
jgi:Fur family transcriptional regulator, ferric uptake regulator